MYYKYKNNFLNYITENNIKLNNLSHSINNIVKLSFEYGYDIVQLMLGEIKDIAPTIFNVGGYIRDKIKRYIYMNEPFLQYKLRSFCHAYFKFYYSLYYK